MVGQRVRRYEIACILVSIVAGCGGRMGGTGGSGGKGGAGGTTGAAGMSGGAGTTATAGTTGAAGTTATAGTTGTAGTSATAGTTGAAGTAATAGTTGTAGRGDTGGQGGLAGQGGSISCGTVERPLSLLAPDILLVQDASGSMNEDAMNFSCVNGCGPNSKWALMTPAIGQVVSETDTQVNWGLKLFAEMGACGVLPTVAVNIAPANAGAIAAALAARTDPSGNVSNGSSTPTRAAENAAVAYLTSLTSPNPKFIVLATDGQPNCPATGNMSNDDTAGAIAAVAAAASAGIPTFVVGISAGGVPEAALNMMAVAGGYPQVGQPTQYYPVTSAAEFAAVLRSLVVMANTCTASIPPPPTNDGTTSRANIGVKVTTSAGTVEIPQSATNGWTYTDASMMSLRLNGTVCDQVRAGTVVAITIVYRCLIR
jgi:Mg-chelatase subunit ChlD